MPSSFPPIRPNFIRLIAAGWLLIFGIVDFSSTFGGEWADLRVQFVYDAEVAPKSAKIAFPDGDPTCMPENLRPISESLLVDPKTKGIRNVVLYPDTKKTAFSPGEIYPDEKTITESEVGIDLINCSYQPHVVAIRVGSRLRITNSDGYGHNPNLIFFMNSPETRLLPPGEAIRIEPQFAERAPTPIHCNIHPWMKAFVMVADHPYVGIGNERGEITIRNLPVGKEIVFRVWHESFSGAIGPLTMRGREVELEQNRLKIKIEATGNDLGRVKLPPSAFGK